MDGDEEEHIIEARASADDLNELLLSTTTASSKGVVASELWVSRQKKRPGRKNTQSSTTSSGASKKSRVEAVALQRDSDLAGEAAGAAAVSSSCHEWPSSKVGTEYELMVHRLMEHVLSRELGGRHNASYHESDECAIPCRAALLAETSSLRPAALYRIHHVVCGYTSTTQTEEAKEDIRTYRKRLYCCNGQKDLVGGHVDGKPLHTRKHLSRLVRQALRGVQAVDVEQRQKSPPTAAGGCDSAHRLCDNPSVLFEGVEKGTLSSFLRSSSSSDVDEDATE
uniref:Uncharacterized protein n=1 Tax=Trypanosoma vivax (strain Y486) TaxID=1055687 RepID=G0UC74_TRYVY|nr:conserved hypothetical protein [Trypanosoma vivax Y486]